MLPSELGCWTRCSVSLYGWNCFLLTTVKPLIDYNTYHGEIAGIGPLVVKFVSLETETSISS